MHNKGLIAFKTGSLLLVVGSVLHLVGHFSDVRPLFVGTEGGIFWELYTEYVFHVGFDRTLFEMMKGFSWTLFLFTGFTGLQNYLLAKHGGHLWELMSNLAVLNLFMSMCLVAVSARYLTIPPLVMFTLIWIAFTLAFLLKGKKPNPLQPVTDDTPPQ